MHEYTLPTLELHVTNCVECEISTIKINNELVGEVSFDQFVNIQEIVEKALGLAGVKYSVVENKCVESHPEPAPPRKIPPSGTYAPKIAPPSIEERKSVFQLSQTDLDEFGF